MYKVCLDRRGNGENQLKQKLASRKFWAAVTGFVSAALVACNVNDMTVEQVVSVVSASAVLISYIIGEGMVDAETQRMILMNIEKNSSA